MEKEQKFIEEMFSKGVLVNKEILSRGLDASLSHKLEEEQDLLVLTADYWEVITQQEVLVDWYQLDHHRVEAEKERDQELYQLQLQQLRRDRLRVDNHGEGEEVSSLEVSLRDLSGQFTTEEQASPRELNPLDFNPLDLNKGVVQVLLSYEHTPQKYDVVDFTRFFSSRYRFLEGILRHRQELAGTTTIKRVAERTERGSAGVIGLVQEMGITKKGSIHLKLEDFTGTISVIIPQSKKDLFHLAKDLVLDEVIGVTGTSQGAVIFADQVVWPDLPEGELKCGPQEEYAIFLSDLHVGSRLFLAEPFEKFLRWLAGEAGNEEQRELARKVKYIFISGDVVDGVGVYPSQEEELALLDIKEQYRQCAALLARIPSEKQIIMCPGNHDVVHIAEPQPIFYKEYAEVLHTLPNVTLLSNPGMVTIGKTENFSGFDVLLYHGYSFDYYVAHVESIRQGGGYHRADLIMKFLLKRRHLAPSFKSTPYCPGYAEDPLLIKRIPDFFATGHIHYCSAANYRGVTMISGSCWQDKTSFQEKLGHQPEPGRVPLVNLKTRDLRVLRFV